MKMKQGFTLVEIMIVVLIIGLLAAIAVPNFTKARKKAQRNACIDNLRQIEGACEQIKMEGEGTVGKDGVITIDAKQIYGSDKYIKVAPTCPSTKVAYEIPSGDNRPVCPNPAVNGSAEEDLHKLPGGGE